MMILRILILCLLMVVAGTVGAQVVALPGIVIEAGEENISIQACGYTAPRVDDLLEIGFKAEDSHQLLVGVWRVEEVKTCFIRVSGVCGAQTPSMGEAATVFINTAGPSPEKMSAQTHSRVSEDVEMTNEIAQTVELLASGNSRNEQKAAKVLYRHYRFEPAAQAAAEAALLSGYDKNGNDFYHVDAMAWLTNILGVSGNPAYHDTLEEVWENAANIKLSKFASKNLQYLE